MTETWLPYNIYSQRKRPFPPLLGPRPKPQGERYSGPAGLFPEDAGQTNSDLVKEDCPTSSILNKNNSQLEKPVIKQQHSHNLKMLVIPWFWYMK